MTKNQIFGHRLRNFRKASGLAVKQLAFDVSMNPSMIRNRERGVSAVTASDLQLLKIAYPDFDVDAFLLGGKYD